MTIHLRGSYIYTYYYWPVDGPRARRGGGATMACQPPAAPDDAPHQEGCLFIAFIYIINAEDNLYIYAYIIICGICIYSTTTNERSVTRNLPCLF